MKRLALLLLTLLLGIPQLYASSTHDTAQQIARIQQERHKLAAVKRQLEQQLGQMNHDMRRLDRALIKARRISRAANAKVRAADRKLAKLRQQSSRLQHEIDTLKASILRQAVAAWQQSAHSSQWMGILTGVPVSDIPHRRYLLQRVIETQEQDRQRYLDAVAQLKQVTQALQQQRDKLEQLRREKQAATDALRQKMVQKRRLVRKLRRDIHRQTKRDNQLAKQEQMLKQLLNHIDEQLLPVEHQPISEQHIRARKGHLEWPLKGRIVAAYHSRPRASMPRLKGVQIRPNKAVKTVRAMAAGQVRYADWFGGYGLMMIVDYGDGVLGVYAHNDALYKQVGDWIEAGEVIADAGSTGWVNSVTLYFEMRDHGKAVNPKRWCRR